MSDWSIGKRLNLLSGALIVAVLIVAVVGAASTLRLAGVFGSFRASAAEALAITKVEENIFRGRLAAFRYRGEPTDVLATQVRRMFAQVADGGTAILAASEHGASDVSELDTVLETARAYVETFERSVEHEARRAAETVVLSEAEEEIRTAIAGLMEQAKSDGDTRAVFLAAGAQAAFLASHIEVESFLVRNGAHSRDAARTELADARGRVAEFGRVAINDVHGDRIAALATQLDRYEAAAAGIFAATTSRNAARAELDRTGPTMQSAIEALRRDLVEHQRRLSASGEAVVAWTVASLAAISIVAAAASLCFARLTGRRIRRAIETSVSEMERLASGDLDFEITGTQQSHELGQMARALRVFRDTAREARVLEARQAEQRHEIRAREEAQKAHAANAAEESRRKAAEARAGMIRDLRASIGSVVEAAAAGDFSKRITAAFDDPELTDMAASVNDLVASVDISVRELARVMSSMAAGDLGVRMTGSFSGVIAELQASVNETVENLARVVTDIAGSCDGVIGQAAAMTGEAGELARRAEQQAASLEQSSAAMEEIAASARSAADAASGASAFAASASARVDAAGRVVATAVEAMDDIRAASERIGEIVSVIDGIAFQTNLLALNASVEAARAGAAGKGFAVVASEVRALAQRSGAASQDIKTLIDETAAQVSRGVELVEATGATLAELVDGVRRMAKSLDELTATGREQAIGVQEVTTALAQLDATTQKTVALADRSRRTAGIVEQSAASMRGLVGTFRTGDPRPGHEASWPSRTCRAAV